MIGARTAWILRQLLDGKDPGVDRPENVSRSFRKLASRLAYMIPTESPDDISWMRRNDVWDGFLLARRDWLEILKEVDRMRKVETIPEPEGKPQ
jgi:hypothetical protein